MWPAYRVLWWMLAAVMGYSRVCLGHHYPLDVAAGAGVGWLVALWVLGRPASGDLRVLDIAPGF